MNALEVMRVKRAMPEGVIWPRFEDGALVKPFDHVETTDGFPFDSEGVQKFIYTTSMGGSWQLQDASGHMLAVVPSSSAECRKTVKRPPLLASDGKLIKVGQVLYGGDGRAWEVYHLERGSKYPVHGVEQDNPRISREMKPEWLTHEEPRDSLQAVMQLLRRCAGLSPDDCRSLAERIGRLQEAGCRDGRG